MTEVSGERVKRRAEMELKCVVPWCDPSQGGILPCQTRCSVRGVTSRHVAQTLERGGTCMVPLNSLEWGLR